MCQESGVTARARPPVTLAVTRRTTVRAMPWGCTDHTTSLRGHAGTPGVRAGPPNTCLPWACESRPARSAPAREAGPRGPCCPGGSVDGPGCHPQAPVAVGTAAAVPARPRWSWGRCTIRPPHVGPGADHTSLCAPSLPRMRFFPRLIKMTLSTWNFFFFLRKAI